MIPPWINRYYIADLAPGKSLVEWAVAHGHTTFVVSFRNPDASMRDLSFDDYLRLGPLTAIDVVREISGSETVNTLSICLGGTMTAMALAYLDACGDQFVHSATYLNSAVDYEGAGSLATVFADPATLESLIRRMEQSRVPAGQGHRPYVRSSAGQRPRVPVRRRQLAHGRAPARVRPPGVERRQHEHAGPRPRASSSAAAYIDNALAHDEYVAMGERLMVSEIGPTPTSSPGSRTTSFRGGSSYRTTQLFKGAVRFVMTSGGHIAGIVCPPGPEGELWTNDELPRDADEWRAGAAEHRDTWWNDWAAWIAERAGELREPPPVGSARHPAIGDAPGEYVAS